MVSKQSNRIFLCHAKEDKAKAKEIYYKLKKHGFNPWLDKLDLLAGQKWDKEIRKALKTSRIVIIFFSSVSVKKRGYVQREMKMALDTLEEIPSEQIFIMPVRIDDCSPPSEFEELHYCDLFEDEGFELLLKAISSQIAIKDGILPKEQPSLIFQKNPINIADEKEKPQIFGDELLDFSSVVEDIVSHEEKGNKEKLVDQVKLGFYNNLFSLDQFVKIPSGSFEMGRTYANFIYLRVDFGGMVV